MLSWIWKKFEHKKRRSAWRMPWFIPIRNEYLLDRWLNLPQDYCNHDVEEKNDKNSVRKWMLSLYSRTWSFNTIETKAHNWTWSLVGFIHVFTEYFIQFGIHLTITLQFPFFVLQVVNIKVVSPPKFCMNFISHPPELCLVQSTICRKKFSLGTVPQIPSYVSGSGTHKTQTHSDLVDGIIFSYYSEESRGGDAVWKSTE